MKQLVGNNRFLPICAATILAFLLIANVLSGCPPPAPPVPGGQSISGQSANPTGRTAVVTVAASNSSALSKSQADYVCDGVNDNVEIKAAWDSASSGEVSLSEGQFNIGAATILNGSNKVLRGQGNGTILKLQTNANCRLLQVTGTYLTIRDMKIDGNKTNQSGWSGCLRLESSASHISIVDAELTSGYTFNLSISDNPGFIDVVRVYSHDCTAHGMEIGNGAHDVTFTGCNSSSNGSRGIYVGSGSTNTLYNIGIFDNTVQSNTSNGIDIAGTAATYNVQVSGNNVTSNLGNGITIGVVGYNLQVRGNIIAVSTGHGIWASVGIHDSQISGNTITSAGTNDTNGIVLSNGGYNLTISENVISSFRGNGYAGITAQSGATNELYDVLISNNGVYSTTNQGVGIRITGTAAKYRVTVSGNKIRDMDSNGIHFNTVTSSIVSNNEVVYTLGGNKAGSGEGIDIYASTKCTITGNYSAGHKHATHGTGISLDTGGSYNSVVGNFCELNSHDGIRIWNSSYNLVDSNVLKDNGENGVKIDGTGTTSYNTIRSNHAYDSGAAVQDYGIRELNTGNYSNIELNTVYGNTTAQINTVGANTKVRRNDGYATENSSTATVANTTTSIVVNHVLATTPTRVILTLTNNPTNDPQVYWVDTLTTTQFTIHTKVDPGATGAIFNWRATVGEGN